MFFYFLHSRSRNNVREKISQTQFGVCVCVCEYSRKPMGIIRAVRMYVLQTVNIQRLMWLFI